MATRNATPHARLRRAPPAGTNKGLGAVDFADFAGPQFFAQGNGSQKQTHPGYSPMLLLASASQQDGKVVVQIARPGLAPPPENGREKPAADVLTWVNMRKVTLGETVQAFDVDGQSVGPKAVLKALAEPRGVAVFARSYPSDPLTPSPFYRAMLRDCTILLVVKAEDIYYPKP